VVVDDKVLLAESGSHSTERMELFGARIGITEEIPGGRELDMNKIKKIVGTTKIQARRMRMDPVTWDATHALFITTNSTPIVKSTDHGAWRRLALVPFPIRYVPEGRLLGRNERRGDLTLRPRVRHDPGVHQAILAWLVAGAGGWYASGRVMPPLPGAVREATDRWRRSSDMILQLLADGVIGFRPGGVVLSMDLYEAYRSWAIEAGQHPWSQNTFMRALVEHPEVETHRVTTERTGKWELSNLTRPGTLRNVFYAKKKQDSILLGVYFPNPDQLKQDEVINKQHALVYRE
jgi:putative DNA primase/helicase